MAYINVIDWKCEQVIDWMKGLHHDLSLYYYSLNFLLFHKAIIFN